jgi:O-succinylbenzoate synthase
LASHGPRIVHASVYEVALRLLKTFVTGFGDTSSRHTVLVHLVDDEGFEGWGEAPALDHPFYLSETTSTTFSVIAEYALALSLQSPSFDPRDVAKSMSSIRGNTFARAGVEAAYWALTSAREGRPISALMGGVATRVAVGESLSIADTIDETLEEVSLRLEEGYQRIKLKIRPRWDVEVVRAVRQTFGDDILLQVDANASYSLDDADMLRGLDDFGLLCIEQPLGYDDIEGSAVLQRLLDTPICLDEAIRNPTDARRALDLDACRNINVKPGRVGGLVASLEIHDLCVERGIPLWCGGMLESGIGRSANLALCSLPGFTQPADMSPASVLYADDLVDPTFVVERDGYVAVPTTSGLGFNVVTQRIIDRTVRFATLDADTEDIRERSLDHVTVN